MNLEKKYLLGMSAGIVSVLLAFTALFFGMYNRQLEDERKRASTDINHLFQASLENAMLKRDLDGLRGIVETLGKQPEVFRVLIINPKGEVRFASEPKFLGNHIKSLSDKLKKRPQIQETTRTIFLENGRELLRSTKPVHNKAPCEECHGSMNENPINGILVVDYDLLTIRRHVRNTTLSLMGTGALVVLITLVGGWWFMRRFVLQPITVITQASNALSENDLSARIKLKGSDELTHLSNTFNQMAENLQNNMVQLNQQRNFLQSLIDGIADGVRVIDKNYRIIAANIAYTKLVNKPLEQILTQTCYQSSHGRCEPCPTTMYTCPLQQILDGNNHLKTIQEFNSDNHKTIYVEIHAAALGKVNKVDAIVESVRNLEQEIQFSHEQKLSSLGKLAAGVAHEIHNPLSSIRFALRAMKKNSKEKTENNNIRYDHYLDIIDNEINNCISVTTRLLKLSASSNNKNTLVNVNEIIEEIASLLYYEGSEQGVKIILELNPDILRVHAADGDIRMIILNLIQNAFHVMPKGGTLNINTLNDNNNIKIIVCDTGTGIADEIKDHIFEPFFTRRNSEIKGTGLGLTICRTLIETCGGNIAVKNNKHKGACFTITLPDATQTIKKIKVNDVIISTGN